jgi:hypothetical protein
LQTIPPPQATVGEGCGAVGGHSSRSS